MRIGDIEYTRHIDNESVGPSSERQRISFAIGLKIRPLLTRVQVSMPIVGVVSADSGVWFENGEAFPSAQVFSVCMSDNRLMPIFVARRTLVTSGFPAPEGPKETTWWKILMPTVTIHAFSGTNTPMTTILHYRWVELTDDEIVEIAAQRGQ